MALLGKMIVALGMDTAEFDSGVTSSREKLSNFAGGAAKVGTVLSAAVTAPLVAVGKAALDASTTLNEKMGNIQSLGLTIERTRELKAAVQDMAISVGKDTGDLSDGLYQILSAFGDGADTVKLLEINAKAAAASLATTEDSLNLTAAVTKAYGDSSAEATQKVADLAFQTALIGQTTFPELAASIGKVTPIAKALGVTQEELFAQLATLTGVTGSTAEVTTQLRATYQALLKPTTDMQGALAQVALELDKQGKLAGGPLVDNWRQAQQAAAEADSALAKIGQQLQAVSNQAKPNAAVMRSLKAAYADAKTEAKETHKALDEASAALGQSIVKSVGLNGALTALSGTAGGNTDKLGKMFGSVEALTAVLSLSGEQAKAYDTNLAAMGQSAGAADRAFQAQTKGINENGFAMKQAAEKIQVIKEKLGDGMGPAILAVTKILEPLANKALALADAFAKADPETQKMIVAAAGIAAALGPATLAISATAAAIAALTSPIGLVVIAIGALAIAWETNFLGIRDKTAAAVTAVGGWFDKLKTWSGAVTSTLASVGTAISKIERGDISLNFTPPAWITSLMSWAWPKIPTVAWVTALLIFTWPILLPVAWVVALMAWLWPTPPGEPSWISRLIKWVWPDFVMPAWLERLFTWHWPTLPALPSWLGGSGGADTSNNKTDNKVEQSRKISIGGYSAPAMATAGGPTVQITGPINIYNDMDVEELTWKIAKALGRK